MQWAWLCVLIISELFVYSAIEQEQNTDTMPTENMRPDVAVFIDFENVYVSVREKLDESPNFESIMDRCNDLGRVVIARAYADWYRYPRITSALYANGIEPMYVPTYYYDKEMGRTGRAIKNSVDMNLCIDAMKTLFMNTNVAKFVLVTGDRDFIPLVNSIRQQGKEVIIIGIGGAASTHLAQSADEFVFYEQLVGKTAPPPSDQKTKSARVGAEVVGTPTLKTEPPAEQDIYDTLVQAIHLVRERGYISTLGSLKLVMKELLGGDFKESRYKDLNGRPFTKFKDFVIDAEKRGKVQIYTSGTVSEVFLPGEDARKLSQFAEFKEEPSTESEADSSTQQDSRQSTAKPTSTVVPPPPPTSSGHSRRRRKPRSQQQRYVAHPPAPTNISEAQNGQKRYATAPAEEKHPSDEPSVPQEPTPSVPDDLEEQKFSKLALGDDTKKPGTLPDGQFPTLENEVTLLFNVDEAITLAQMIDSKTIDGEQDDIQAETEPSSPPHTPSSDEEEKETARVAFSLPEQPFLPDSDNALNDEAWAQALSAATMERNQDPAEKIQDLSSLISETMPDVPEEHQGFSAMTTAPDITMPFVIADEKRLVLPFTTEPAYLMPKEQTQEQAEVVQATPEDQDSEQTDVAQATPEDQDSEQTDVAQATPEDQDSEQTDVAQATPEEGTQEQTEVAPTTTDAEGANEQTDVAPTMPKEHTQDWVGIPLAIEDPSPIPDEEKGQAQEADAQLADTEDRVSEETSEEEDEEITLDEETDEEMSEIYVTFSDEEWHTFCTMMTSFSKPVSFNQIFDSLRELRKQQIFTRTNEQLRNLVKQAINNGVLDRSGRGKRVYYNLNQAILQDESEATEDGTLDTQ